MYKASLLRKHFEEKERIIYLAGAHDGLSAKLVEKNGFDGIWASGFEISTSYGVPDASILTMSQYLDRTIDMNNVTSLPIVADCDTGFGNSSNVMYMVKKYESAGIAAVCIEDKRFPKVNSYVEGRQELAPVAEFVGKIMAAKHSQNDKDFMVIARTEALISGLGHEEAIRRANAYVEAGADAILIHSKAKTSTEVKKFCRHWKNKSPVIIVPTSYPSITEKEIIKMKVKMVIYANHGIRSSIKAMDSVYGKIKKKGISGIDKTITPMKEVFELQGMDKMKKNEEIFLHTDKEPIRVVIPAAGQPKSQDELSSILTDMPVAMLDINGKPLIQHNIETFNQEGLYDITIITGYQKDKVNISNENKKIYNPDFKRSHILESIMKAEGVFDRKILLNYSDVLFDRSIVNLILQQDSDILIVGDPSFKKLPVRNKKLDLVKAKYRPMIGKRSLLRRNNPVVSMGPKMQESEADYEFIGMILFSKKGIDSFKKEYYKAKKKYKRDRFHNAVSFRQANFSDLANEMVLKGYNIEVMEVNSGWVELHSFENYKLACNMRG